MHSSRYWWCRWFAHKVNIPTHSRLLRHASLHHEVSSEALQYLHHHATLYSPVTISHSRDRFYRFVAAEWFILSTAHYNCRIYIRTAVGKGLTTCDFAFLTGSEWYLPPHIHRTTYSRTNEFIRRLPVHMHDSWSGELYLPWLSS